MHLRSYQTNLIAQIYEAFKTDNRVVCQLATGAGKTPIAASIIKGAIDQKVPTLFIAHREELLTQAQPFIAIESQNVRSVGYRLIPGGSKSLPSRRLAK